MKPKNSDIHDATSYLLKSPANARHLEESLRQLREGKTKVLDFAKLMRQSKGGTRINHIDSLS
ncbi:type II toxin-antitoxin system Phd/YefM family antitoxin [Prosthecobacter vanneervenii]|uniref:Uncharacterized protein n=1 Tax=Prosthecobacter vanneervenii TaxID=48466 RepID=A0A7W7YFG9_9BACT|nr:hypothetical protein [Prosthecobacter vanneervenii]MBB5035213.1 hypothetical protein [Prosthecobacter vanneervenii]